MRVRFDLRRLLRWFRHCGCETFDTSFMQREVRACFSTSRLMPPDSVPEPPEGVHDESVYHDWERIAWLVQHGWKDPILVDVGAPSLGVYPALFDGWHRLAAATYCRKPWILADPAGDCAVIARLTYRVGQRKRQA